MVLVVLGNLVLAIYVGDLENNYYLLLLETMYLIRVLMMKKAHRTLVQF